MVIFLDKVMLFECRITIMDLGQGDEVFDSLSKQLESRERRSGISR